MPQRQYHLSQPTCKRKGQRTVFYVASELSSNNPPLADEMNNNNENHGNLLGNNATDTADTNFEWETVVLPPECDLESMGDGTSPSSPCIIPLDQHPGMSTADQTLLAGSALTVAAMFGYLIWAAGAGGWRYYLAGGICAAVSHLIPVPVDVVKTRKQIDPTLATATFGQATREILQKEGWPSLFVGAGPTFWGYFLEGAIKFGIYEVLKPTIKTLIPIQSLAFVVSAAISGLAASLMVCPMEALRIRLVAEPSYAKLGWVQGGCTMMKKEGVAPMAKSLLPMIYKQVPYTITKNVSFDLFTKLAYGTIFLNAASLSATQKVAIPLASAAMASMLSCISSQPGDMLLSVANANSGDRRTHDICRDIMRSERGFRGFFVGIKTRFLHVGIIVTLQLMIYDFVKRSCGIAATGTV